MRLWTLVPSLCALGLLAACGDSGSGAAATHDGGAAPSSGSGGASAADAKAESGGAAQASGGSAGSAASGTAGAVGSGITAHTRCGWLGAGEAELGVESFVANADWFQAVHPDWYALDTDAESIRTLSVADDPVVVSTALAHGVELSPMIAAVDDVSILRAMLNDPDKRSAHVANLVSLAVDKGYAGLDIDYEHLWDASDRPGFSAFIAELSDAMHAAGKKISIAVPALDNASSNNAWDYDVLSQELDTLHVMGYDFHSVGTHSGPVAPLGWIDAVAAQIEATGHADRFVLGVPNYGTTPTWYGNGATCAAACGPGYATVTDHMLTCPYGNFAAGRAPHCTTDNGDLFFDDTPSLEEKIASAKAHGLRGVTYWAMGGEPDGFFAMVKKYYP